MEQLYAYAYSLIARALHYAIQDVTSSRPRNPVKMIADILRTRIPKNPPSKISVEEGSLEAAEVRAYLDREVTEPLNKALTIALQNFSPQDEYPLTSALADALERVANEGDYSARDRNAKYSSRPPWYAGDDAGAEVPNSPAATMNTRVNKAMEVMDLSVEAALEAASTASPSTGSQRAAVAGATMGSAVLSEAIAAASEAAYAARQEGVPKLVVLEALRGASIASQGSLRQVEAALQAAGYDAKREIMQQSEVLRLQHRRIEEEMSLEHL